MKTVLGREFDRRPGKNRSAPRGRRTIRTLTRLVSGLALFSGLTGPSAFPKGPFYSTPGCPAQAEMLQRVLDLAEDYCRRLDTASLYYVCREDVRESHVATLERSSPFGPTTLDVSFDEKTRSEYGFEKNGLRFPSRYSISLEWRERDTPKLVQSPEARMKTSTEVEVVYSDYKFFTVEVEIKQS